MIYFDIFLNSAENSCRTFVVSGSHVGNDTTYAIYDHLFYKLEQTHEVAEDASSWCEFATIGESYETDDFTITVREGRF